MSSVERYPQQTPSTHQVTSSGSKYRKPGISIPKTIKYISSSGVSSYHHLSTKDIKNTYRIDVLQEVHQILNDKKSFPADIRFLELRYPNSSTCKSAAIKNIQDFLKKPQLITEHIKLLEDVIEKKTNDKTIIPANESAHKLLLLKLKEIKKIYTPAVKLDTEKCKKADKLLSDILKLCEIHPDIMSAEQLAKLVYNQTLLTTCTCFLKEKIKSDSFTYTKGHSLHGHLHANFIIFVTDIIPELLVRIPNLPYNPPGFTPHPAYVQNPLTAPDQFQQQAPLNNGQTVKDTNREQTENNLKRQLEKIERHFKCYHQKSENSGYTDEIKADIQTLKEHMPDISLSQGAPIENHNRHRLTPETYSKVERLDLQVQLLKAEVHYRNFLSDVYPSMEQNIRQSKEEYNLPAFKNILSQFPKEDDLYQTYQAGMALDDLQNSSENEKRQIATVLNMHNRIKEKKEKLAAMLPQTRQQPRTTDIQLLTPSDETDIKSQYARPDSQNEARLLKRNMENVERYKIYITNYLGTVETFSPEQTKIISAIADGSDLQNRSLSYSQLNNADQTEIPAALQRSRQALTAYKLISHYLYAQYTGMKFYKLNKNVQSAGTTDERYALLSPEIEKVRDYSDWVHNMKAQYQHSTVNSDIDVSTLFRQPLLDSIETGMQTCSEIIKAWDTIQQNLLSQDIRNANELLAPLDPLEMHSQMNSEDINIILNTSAKLIEASQKEHPFKSIHQAISARRNPDPHMQPELIRSDLESTHVQFNHLTNRFKFMVKALNTSFHTEQEEYHHAAQEGKNLWMAALNTLESMHNTAQFFLTFPMLDPEPAEIEHARDTTAEFSAMVKCTMEQSYNSALSDLSDDLHADTENIANSPDWSDESQTFLLNMCNNINYADNIIYDMKRIAPNASQKYSQAIIAGLQEEIDNAVSTLHGYIIAMVANAQNQNKTQHPIFTFIDTLQRKYPVAYKELTREDEIKNTSLFPAPLADSRHQQHPSTTGNPLIFSENSNSNGLVTAKERQQQEQYLIKKQQEIQESLENISQMYNNYSALLTSGRHKVPDQLLQKAGEIATSEHIFMQNFDSPSPSWSQQELHDQIMHTEKQANELSLITYALTTHLNTAFIVQQAGKVMRSYPYIEQVLNLEAGELDKKTTKLESCINTIAGEKKPLHFEEKTYITDETSESLRRTLSEQIIPAKDDTIAQCRQHHHSFYREESEAYAIEKAADKTIAMTSYVSTHLAYSEMVLSLWDLDDLLGIFPDNPQAANTEHWQSVSQTLLTEAKYQALKNVLKRSADGTQQIQKLTDFKQQLKNLTGFTITSGQQIQEKLNNGTLVPGPDSFHVMMCVHNMNAFFEAHPNVAEYLSLLSQEEIQNLADIRQNLSRFHNDTFNNIEQYLQALRQQLDKTDLDSDKDRQYLIKQCNFLASYSLFLKHEKDSFQHPEASHWSLRLNSLQSHLSNVIDTLRSKIQAIITSPLQNRDREEKTLHFIQSIKASHPDFYSELNLHQILVAASPEHYTLPAGAAFSPDRGENHSGMTDSDDGSSDDGSYVSQSLEPTIGNNLKNYPLRASRTESISSSTYLSQYSTADEQEHTHSPVLSVNATEPVNPGQQYITGEGIVKPLKTATISAPQENQQEIARFVQKMTDHLNAVDRKTVLGTEITTDLGAKTTAAENLESKRGQEYIRLMLQVCCQKYRIKTGVFAQSGPVLLLRSLLNVVIDFQNPGSHSAVQSACSAFVRNHHCNKKTELSDAEIEATWLAIKDQAKHIEYRPLYEHEQHNTTAENQPYLDELAFNMKRLNGILDAMFSEAEDPDGTGRQSVYGQIISFVSNQRLELEMRLQGQKQQDLHSQTK